jgi:putative tryptophan/tyrosine transport system substrate-binding protein
MTSPVLFANRRVLFEHAIALRLPAIYQWPEMAREGGLAGYRPSIVQLFRDVLSRQLVKLLEGANPTDLPVEQPTKFELVINVNAAKALGLTIPRSMLMLADEVIE